MSNAMITVMSTPELLESILSQLPMRNLLRMHSVCQYWHQFISESPILGQKLFFKPCLDEDLLPMINPLLVELLPPFFDMNEISSSRSNCSVSAFHELDWFKNKEKRASVLRVDASWRRMYPVQPPTKIDLLLEGSCSCNLIYEREGMISDEFAFVQEFGASMGLIYDIVVYLLDEAIDSAFSIQWHIFPFRSSLRKQLQRLCPNQVEEIHDRAVRISEKKSLETITIYITHSDASCGDHCKTPSWLKIVEFQPRVLTLTEARHRCGYVE